MKKTQALVALSIFLTIFLAATVVLAIRVDESALRCDGGVVAVGDLERYVIQKCGQPLRISRPSRNVYRDGYRVWIYRFNNQYVYYLNFINERLQRIQSERCWQDNPDCE
ncbi:MAG: DUF2845 domain-containing protein [Desulfobacterales bacterium]|nr:DUF2845 domain-containing protein [Desulfobacterales bacterium]MDJ0913441.1 DUF2845 domain-containing protein [Desulfobacterales bacterium]